MIGRWDNNEKIAICDDNKSDLFQLKDLILSCFEKYTSDITIDIYQSGADLLKSCNKNEYEILFLDIDMPDVTGFDIDRRIREDF